MPEPPFSKFTVIVGLRRPDLVQAFVDATIEGWTSYLYGDPKPGNAMIRKNNPDMTDDQLAFGLALMTLGLFQKIVLADGFLGPAAEAVGEAAEGGYDHELGEDAEQNALSCVEGGGRQRQAECDERCQGLGLRDRVHLLLPTAFALIWVD